MLKKYLGKTVDVIIDRPLGSSHPNYPQIYPINYGYIPNTISSDGEEIDAYVLGIDKPLKTFRGKVIAIIHRLNDTEDKLVVAKENLDFTNEQIIKQTYFQEQWFKSEIIR